MLRSRYNDPRDAPAPPSRNPPAPRTPGRAGGNRSGPRGAPMARLGAGSTPPVFASPPALAAPGGPGRAAAPDPRTPAGKPTTPPTPVLHRSATAAGRCPRRSRNPLAPGPPATRQASDPAKKSSAETPAGPNRTGRVLSLIHISEPT